jgi:hypothetical protein
VAREKPGEDVLALIPLDLDGYVLEGWESKWQSFVTGRFIGDFTDEERFEDEVERLIKALRAGARKPPPEPRLQRVRPR